MPEENDGGYYAIKGFLYQFDKALIEIMSNPDIEVGIEQKQDIDYQDFVIQVKHKETQEFKDSKIKKPVQKLIELFKTDQTQKSCLYCHFNDKETKKWVLTLTELDIILGDLSGNYPLYLKEKFIESFYIQFSEDFEAQFFQVINLIKSSFRLADVDLAYIYHSLLRSKLLDISIKAKGERQISKHDLDDLVHDAEKTVFYIAYSKYLNKSKYEQLVKKEFFTFKAANIENFERLFIIQCGEGATRVELYRIVTTLIHKYFRPEKSPQPYLCIIGMEDHYFIDLKQDLLDQGVQFDDGTYFDGDKFRLDRIIEKKPKNSKTGIKIVNHVYLDKLISKVKFHEIYQFYLVSPVSIDTEHSHIKIQIIETKQVLRMIT